MSKSHCLSNVYLCCQGRLAFQALFKREVLPQSFSPPHAKEGEQGKGEAVRENDKEGEIEERGCSVVPTVDLNKNACIAVDLLHPFVTGQGILIVITTSITLCQKLVAPIIGMSSSVYSFLV